MKDAKIFIQRNNKNNNLVKIKKRKTNDIFGFFSRDCRYVEFRFGDHCSDNCIHGLIAQSLKRLT